MPTPPDSLIQSPGSFHTLCWASVIGSRKVSAGGLINERYRARTWTYRSGGSEPHRLDGRQQVPTLIVQYADLDERSRMIGDQRSFKLGLACVSTAQHAPCRPSLRRRLSLLQDATPHSVHRVPCRPTLLPLDSHRATLAWRVSAEEGRSGEGGVRVGEGSEACTVEPNNRWKSVLGVDTDIARH